MSDARHAALRALPSVDALAALLREAEPDTDPADAVAVARAVLATRRTALLADAAPPHPAADPLAADTPPSNPLTPSHPPHPAADPLAADTPPSNPLTPSHPPHPTADPPATDTPPSNPPTPTSGTQATGSPRPSADPHGTRAAPSDPPSGRAGTPPPGSAATASPDPQAAGAAQAELLVAARAALRPSLRRVLNATGVILHTNLGRAPLADAAVRAITATAGGATNLELDLETGTRGGRDTHAGALATQLTGAEDALVVNNGAAAALLAATALGGPGARIVISRGQLVEIGGGFRVPDVIAQSGAELVEVGTTNRTRLADYAGAVERADGRRTVVMRVHPSNFRTVGFTAEVEIEALTGLGVPVIDDVGSGRLDDGLTALADEPSVRRSVRAGAALTCFSADKLLGGPQAGLLVGGAEAVATARRHPLARALRPGRLTLAALEATLRLHRDPARARREIPVLAMLDAPAELLAARAHALAEGTGGTVVDAVARVGGGALPLLELVGPAVALPDPDPQALAGRLRRGEPPVLARIADGRVLLDPRTLHGEDEIALCVAAVRRARAAQCSAGGC